ncbi:molecular chaperone TorD family protein [Aromatoleum petrolei]|uniref:Uncharacterized protein n=1 Tax=Aromatoleum petrolei TaxID=76116 RepID=A0ABX1MU96_9RHOO|nr:molecular chaperone TorD family protein [Aromatoleum petrolei]NMF89906.1 hypothetical protein [Aromatoleum petrolei]
MNDDVRAELWITLARALMLPRDPALLPALRDALPESLVALLPDAIDADVAAALDLLTKGFGRFADSQALLVHYSRCFLSPPIRVPLNLGLYLDGLPGGAAFESLQHWMLAYGVVRCADFPEQADHLGCVLELLAIIEDAGDVPRAADFAHAFLLPTLPRLEERFAADEDGEIRESPYRTVLALLQTALRATHPVPATMAERRAKYRQRPIGDGWRRCGRCGAPIATEKELAVIEAALLRQDLPVAHLDLCPDCRDAARGWTKRSVCG